MTYRNALHPQSINDMLPSLRAVASAAERRAAELRDLVTTLENTDVDMIDAHIGDEHAGPGYVRDLLARVDETSHIHSGSSDASQVRTLTSGMLSLLATLQRKNKA